MDVHCLSTKEAVKQGDRGEYRVQYRLNTAQDRNAHRDLVSKLAIHQLEGVRFLNNQLREYSGVFLNDETGLGKCYQIVALLSGTAVGERPSIIVCPNRERAHHWMYHLDVLSPSLRSRVHPKSQLEVANELTVLKRTEWQYAIVDETRGFMTTPELEMLRELAAQKYIFLSSRDLLDELKVLSERLEFACGESSVAIRSMIEPERKHRTKRASFRIYLCTRRFILRRRVINYRAHLPRLQRSEFSENFNIWKVANGIDVSQTSANPVHTQSVEYSIPTVRSADFLLSLENPFPGGSIITPEATDQTHQYNDMADSCRSFLSGQQRLTDADADRVSSVNIPKAATVHYAGSEPMFDLNETDTEQMPPLRVESDTPSENEGSIPEDCRTIPETATNSQGYLQFGQQISGGSTSTQPVLADDRYRFPVEKFLPQSIHSNRSGSSLSAESIINVQPPVSVVTISSSDSPARSKSPPLFEEDTDNDTVSLNSDDDISLLEMLRRSSTKRVPARGQGTPRAGTKRAQPGGYSTPIAKLMNATLTNETPQRDADVSSIDMFGISPSVSAARVAFDNVFEITKNDAFANRIAVTGENGGIPTMRILDDSSDDDDDVQFVNATAGVIDLDDTSSTPKASSERNKTLTMQRTPPGSGSILGSSPRRGWLGKSVRLSSASPRSNDTTPTTSRNTSARGEAGGTLIRDGAHVVRHSNRRRKLEELFKDVEDTDRTKRSHDRARRCKTDRR